MEQDNSILMQLFDAHIGFNGRPFSQDSPYVKYARTKAENMEKLNGELSKAQKEALEAYLDADSEINEIICVSKFTYGFHLGAMLMMEMLKGQEEMLA